MKKTKIKVVQVIADSDLGGGPNHVLSILRNLDKDKFECSLICPGGRLSIKAKEIPAVDVYNVPMNSRFDLKAFFAIKEALHKIQAGGYPFTPMVAHFHGARAGFLGRIIMPRHMATVYTEHSIDENYHLADPIREWMQKKLLARLNENTNLVIAVSSSVKRYLIENELAPEQRTVVIPNGIDFEEFAKRRSIRAKIHDTSHRTPIVGSIGSLNRQKGFRYLIEAMPEILKHYPLLTLEIIGKGPEKEKLEELVKERELTHHVAFLGEKTDILDYLEHWSVFVLPSVSETFGIVLLEAMHSGLPIVASKVGGITDLIEHEKNGLLVEPKSSKAIAHSVLKLLDDQGLAAKIKKHGLSRVEDFDWQHIIKRIENSYVQLTKSTLR